VDGNGNYDFFKKNIQLVTTDIWKLTLGLLAPASGQCIQTVAYFLSTGRRIWTQIDKKIRSEIRSAVGVGFTGSAHTNVMESLHIATVPRYGIYWNGLTLVMHARTETLGHLAYGSCRALPGGFRSNLESGRDSGSPG
jgi:hypothetical protein